ncbi:MAG: hypothetical protein QM589_00185 [Thermomicrobiales bacterium]
MTDRSTDLADALDHAWDDHPPGADPLLDRLMALGQTDTDARQRVYARFLALTASSLSGKGRSPMNVAALARSRPTAIPSLERRHWRLPWRFVMGVAIGAAFLLLVGIVLGTWLRSDIGPSGIRHELAALVGLDSNPRDVSVNANALVTPGNAPDGRITMVAWLVTLDPGGEFRLPAGYESLGKYPIDVQLVEGEVTVIASESTVTIPGPGEKSSGPLLGDIYAYRNDSSKPVQLLVLGPNGATTAGAGPGTEWHGLAQVDISTNDGYQVNVFADELDESSLVHRLPQGRYVRSPETAAPYTALAIQEGSVIDSDGTIYPAGSTIDLTKVPADTLRPLSTSGSPLKAFALGYSPLADNPTLDPMVESIAPYWLTWAAPSSGTMTTVLRVLTIDPGQSFAMPSDAYVGYAVSSGTGELAASNHAQTMVVQTSVTVMQEQGGTLTFTADGASPLTILQVIAGADQAVTQASKTPPPSGISVVSLASNSSEATGGRGSLSIRLAIGTGGEGMTRASNLSFVLPLVGSVGVERQGGEAYVQRKDGTTETDLPLGDATMLEPGDVYIGEPNSGWYVSQDSGGWTVAVVNVSFGSKYDHADVPATPGVQSEGAATVITGNPDACKVTPITLADVNALAATPFAGPSFGERSLRNATGTSADEATRSEAIAMLTGFVDCSSTGVFAQSATYFSDQALREQAQFDDSRIRDRIGNSQEEGVYPKAATVEDIVVFPDGRVGVRIVLESEAAYLTLVKQDGEWKIDVWDDREMPTNATPAVSPAP